MKNLFSIFTFALVALLSFNVNAQDIKSLDRDKDFENFVIEQYRLTEKGDSKVLIELGKNGLESEADLAKFLKAISKSQSGYEGFVKSQDARADRFASKFNFKSYKEKELNQILKGEIGEVYSRYYFGQAGSNCATTYNNAIIANAAAALAGHMGCASLDVTIIAGIICHGAVATAHYLYNQNAYTAYQDCLGN